MGMFNGKIMMCCIDGNLHACITKNVDHNAEYTEVVKFNSTTIHIVKKCDLCEIPIHRTTLSVFFGIEDFIDVARIPHKNYDVFIEHNKGVYLLSFCKKEYKTYCLDKKSVCYISDIQNILNSLT